ncbi:MAG: folate family ECF transporter S component [Clostridia bacterium]|nr:folate family ECF transporter S component [Clostridia bacterium]
MPKNSFRGVSEKGVFVLKKDSKVYKLVLLGVLIAMEIVLNRFLSINTWSTKIGFAFIPVAVAAILLGPAAAAIVGGLGDFIGAILFPIGPYFPGFTATAALMGLVFGLFFHKKQTAARIAFAVIINQFILGLLVNTFWISLLYGSPFKELLATRVGQSGILTVVQIAVILALSKVIDRIRPSLPAEVKHS